MGIFEIERVRKYLDARYQTVVETGTTLGYSTLALARSFKVVHTVELNENLYKIACRNFEKFTSVECHFGDSKEILPRLIPTLSGQVVFFLDAHWSGDDSVDWDNSVWKGYGVDTSYFGDDPTPENQSPLLEEIKIIVDNYPEECIIYIDDADKFDENGKGKINTGFMGENWSHLSVDKIKEIIKDRMITFDLVEDQLVIKLRSLTDDEPVKDIKEWSPAIKVQGPRGFDEFNGPIIGSQEFSFGL